MSTKARECVCGNRNVAWGSDRIESVSFLHCCKCNRYVQAETLPEAIEKWNAPARIADAEAATEGRRTGYEIY